MDRIPTKAPYKSDRVRHYIGDSVNPLRDQEDFPETGQSSDNAASLEGAVIWASAWVKGR